MKTISIILIAFGLAMDAFAVSVASGFIIKKLKFRQAFKIAFSFGGFQAIMPVLGWLAGLSIKGYIEQFDHWIAFALLGFIGGKMIYESFKIEKKEKSIDPLKFAVLLTLSIATSIDALAIGLTFAVLKVSIWTPIIIIGVITFILSLLGVYVGNRFGHFFEKKIEFIGGVVLIAIGIKILIEHLL